MIQKSNLEEISQNININAEINKQDEINKSQITLPQSMVEKKKEESNDFSKDSSNIIEDTQIVKTYEKVNSIEIKQIKEPEIVEEPKYVSLNKRFEIDEKVDSGKMKAVKEAVIKYQESKGTVQEYLRLRELIAMCNNYTKGKIFKFGVAAKRLEEVKAVRRAAETELEKVKRSEGDLSYEKKNERNITLYSEMLKNEKFYAPDITDMRRKKQLEANDLVEQRAFLRTDKRMIKAIKNTYSGIKYETAKNLALWCRMNEMKDADQIDFDQLDEHVEKKFKDKRAAKKLDDRIKELKRYFPSMSHKYAKTLATSEKEKGKKLDNPKDMKLLFKEEKVNKWFKDHDDHVKKQEEKERVDRIVRSNHNAVAAFFVKMIPLQVRNEKLEEKLMMIQFSNDIGNKTYARNLDDENYVLPKPNDDYETTFI